jgi:hypothetical protein
VAVQAEPAVRVGGEGDPAAPAEGVVGQPLDHDRALHAGKPAQLLLDEQRLDAALRGEGDVLVVAPAAATRPGEGARRLDPVR